MDKGNFFLFGTFVKVHGVKGELIIRSIIEIPEEIENIPFLFIELDGLLVPFAVIDLFAKSNVNAVALLEDVINKDQALDLVDKNVYIRKEDIILQEKEKTFSSELLGFSITDQDGNHFGPIIEIIDIPGNPIASVMVGKKEVLIPVNPGAIISIDYKARNISLNISGGLIDIYL